MKETLTHKDLADTLGVSVTTIKSYRAKFPGALPVASRGKPIRFLPEAANVCRHIREGFLANKPVRDIRTSLIREFAFIKDHAQGKGKEPSETAKALLQLTRSLDMLREEQRETNARLEELRVLFADFLNLQASQGNKEAREIRQLGDRVEQVLAGAKPETGEAVRRIRVRDSQGRDTVYAFDKEGNQGKAGQTAISEHLRTLPLVVRTERNEFLGVAGRSAGPFSLEDFIALLEERHPAPKQFKEDSERKEKGVQIVLTQEEAIRPASFSLFLEGMQTPKGNEVAVLKNLEISGMDVPPANLFGVIKGLKEGRTV